MLGLYAFIPTSKQQLFAQTPRTSTTTTTTTISTLTHSHAVHIKNNVVKVDSTDRLYVKYN